MDTKTIGDKIAKARKKMNISQAQLAQRVFVSPQAVGKWERGESLPDIITLSHLTEILGVDLNYFSENAQSPDNGTTPVTINNDDIEPSAKEGANHSGTQERLLVTKFTGSHLSKSDFAGVTSPGTKFNGCDLRGSNFAGADLTGSSFMASDIREANFDGANLTECTLYATDLTDASFSKTILIRTEFSKLGLTGTKFTDVKLIDVKLTTTDLRKTIFTNCVFDGVDFNYSDLRGLCLDGQTFIGVKFHNAALNEATFNGATLRNVSFRSTYALTNRYYRAIKTIRFDGAMIDKLSYAALKGIGADLSKVAVI